MVDPDLKCSFLLAEKDWELLKLRAQVRDLEARLGTSSESDGLYVMARWRLLEQVHDAALRAVRAEPGFVELAEACEAVETLQAPACRDGDHQVAA